MIKNRSNEAHKVFKRIAKSNKKTNLNQVETIKSHNNQEPCVTVKAEQTINVHF